MLINIYKASRISEEYYKAHCGLNYWEYVANFRLKEIEEIEVEELYYINYALMISQSEAIAFASRD